MISKKEYNSIKGGPKVLILAAIHGNEPCGTYAIREVCDLLDSNTIQLLRGSVTFVDVSNPQAFKKGKRYIDQDLNRIFQKHTLVDNYEKKLANDLTDIIDRHDYILDIHSTTEETPAFCFQDYDDLETIAITEYLNLKYIIKGWSKLYSSTNMGDTLSYVYSKGKKGVLIECGQHNDSHSKEIATKSICRFLGYLDMLDTNYNHNEVSEYIDLEKVIFKEKSGLFSKKWKNFDFIEKGEVIAKYSDGEVLTAKNSFFIIMPNNKVNIGEDWYYEGVSQNKR